MSQKENLKKKSAKQGCNIKKRKKDEISNTMALCDDLDE